MNEKKSNGKIVNLTPHTIRVVSGNPPQVGEIPPSGLVARVEFSPPVEVQRITVDNVEVPVIKQEKVLEIVGLPPPQPDTLYLVSSVVRVHARALYPDRDDLVSPGRFLRDPNGNILGCTMFVM
jgi:hypothetical protein